MHAPQPIIAVTGEAGEDRTLHYLQVRGLAVVSRNYRCKGDETDLMMRDAAGAPIFVELRARVARSTQHSGGAATNIAPAKQRHLIAAVEGSLVRQVEDVPACQFDIIAINGARIEWMHNALGVDA